MKRWKAKRLQWLHSMDIAEQFDVIKKINDGEFFKPNGILLQCISERRNRL
jgi:hypothetical protein